MISKLTLSFGRIGVRGRWRFRWNDRDETPDRWAGQSPKDRQYGILSPTGHYVEVVVR